MEKGGAKIHSAAAAAVFFAAILIVASGFIAGLDGTRKFIESSALLSRFLSLNETYGTPGAVESLALIPYASCLGLLFLALIGIEWRRGFKDADRLRASAWWIVPAGLILYLPFLSSILAIGDSAIYAGMIEHRDLGVRTVHWGNTLLGIIWTSILPFDTALDMNLWGILAGIAASMVAAKIAEELAGDRLTGLLTGLFLLCSATWWYQSVFYKSYIGQTMWWMIALYFWIKDRPALSGIMFLMSMLYSPLAVLAAPAFLLGRVNFKKIGIFAAVSLPFYLVFLFYYRQDFFFGPRGLFGVSGGSDAYETTMLIKVALLYLAINFNAAWLIAPAGVPETFTWPRSKSMLFWIAAAVCFAVMFLFGMRFSEFPSSLAIMIFPAMLMGMSFTTLTKRGVGRSYAIVIVAAALIVTAFISAVRQIPEYGVRNTYRNVCLEVGPKIAPGDAVVLRWGQKMIFEEYVYKTVYTDNVIDYEGILYNKGDLSAAIAGYKRVWVLEKDVASAVGRIVPLNREKMAGGWVWLGEIKNPEE